MDENPTIVNLSAGQAGPPFVDNPTPVVEQVAEPEPEKPEEPTNEQKIISPPDNLPALNLAEISVDLIKPNPWQPRKVFNEEALKELSASIKEHGVLQPLVVVPLPDGMYQLIVGERRLRASKMAGLTKAPGLVGGFLEGQRK